MRKSKISLILILLMAGLALIWGWWQLDGDRDLRIVSFGNWGMELVNISMQRRLVTVTHIPPDYSLWVPGGYGRYEAGNLGKLMGVAGEGDQLLGKVLFFNFGLVADKLKLTEEEGWWREKLALWEIRGIKWWLNWRRSERAMLIKEETWYQSVDGDRMGAEYANTAWLTNNDLRWVVVNRSGVDGLAAMVAEKLEWAGIWVTGVSNGLEMEGNCRVEYPVGRSKNSEEIINSISAILGCDTATSVSSDLLEVVVWLNGGWGRMLKYDNNVRSF